MAQEIKILNPTVETPDSPSDCCLVVALPLEQEEFLRQLNDGPEGNFTKSFREFGRSKLSSQGVYFAYERFADLAKDVIRNVSNLGVTVVRSARLSDFASAVADFRVTTLFAHSRDARFLASDIVDAPLLAQELTRPDSAVRKVADDLSKINGRTEQFPKTSQNAEMVLYLNQLIAPAGSAAGAASPRIGATTREQLGWCTRRRLIDDSLPGAFQGGASIEFSDGFQTLESILAVIPGIFSGKLDLTSCNSTVFAEEVRRKCRECLLMTNEESASLDFRLAIYRQVIRRLSRRPQPYEDALFVLRKELL